MIQKMQELLNCNISESILDLYCGNGVMALVFAPRVERVIGIDLNSNSIAAAQENASLNQIKNALFLVANLQKGLKNSIPTDFSPEIVLIDPPRKGLLPQLIKEITELQPSRIVYISCNPQTLVNDLLLFSQFQYGANEIFPFDLFPQTAHLENLVILQKMTE
jgi:23S rRNA (uracil1939-C5)-methyltransferase